MIFVRKPMHNEPSAVTTRRKRHPSSASAGVDDGRRRPLSRSRDPRPPKRGFYRRRDPLLSRSASRSWLSLRGRRSPPPHRSVIPVFGPSYRSSRRTMWASAGSNPTAIRPMRCAGDWMRSSRSSHSVSMARDSITFGDIFGEEDSAVAGGEWRKGGGL